VQFFSNFDGKKEKPLYFLLSDLVKIGYFLKECQDNKKKWEIRMTLWVKVFLEAKVTFFKSVHF